MITVLCCRLTGVAVVSSVVRLSVIVMGPDSSVLLDRVEVVVGALLSIVIGASVEAGTEVGPFMDGSDVSWVVCLLSVLAGEEGMDGFSLSFF